MILVTGRVGQKTMKYRAIDLREGDILIADVYSPFATNPHQRELRRVVIKNGKKYQAVPEACGLEPIWEIKDDSSIDNIIDVIRIDALI